MDDICLTELFDCLEKLHLAQTRGEISIQVVSKESGYVKKGELIDYVFNKKADKIQLTILSQEKDDDHT